MTNILFLYDCQSDKGTIAGGSWQTGLPLANLKSERLEKVARSTSVSPSSTLMRVDLPSPHDMRALALGPSNLSTSYSRRIRAYADSDRTELLHDSGWARGAPQAPWNTLDWSSPAFWDGVSPRDDEERGLWLIYVPAEPVVAQYWTIEIDDSANPAGYVEFGRLFMGRHWQPALNYMFSNNGLSFQDNSVKASTLAGNQMAWRRVNPRVFQCGWDHIAKNKLFGDAYEFQRRIGFDREVFVIPDPQDTEFIQRRAFLSRATRMDALSLAVFNHGSTGFEFREVL